jgi:hypothetical protein
MPADRKDWTMFDHLTDLTAEDGFEDRLFGLEVVAKMAKVGDRFLAGDLNCWHEAFPELNPDLRV